MPSTTRVTRREALRIFAIAGVAGVTAYKIGFQLFGDLPSVTESRYLMGTLINLTVASTDRQAARQAVSLCLDRMQTLERLLSVYNDQSQVIQLNQGGSIRHPDTALLELVEVSHALSEQTGGAFDITIKPLADIYQEAFMSSGTLPSAQIIDQARHRVGYQALQGDRHSLGFLKKGMALTLDGIGKGYIVDQGVKALRDQGFEQVLVEAGGDLMGLNPAQASWTVGVQSPRGSGLVTRFKIHNQGVATSGDYLHSYTPDSRHHHIIDPRTGYSSQELASATVRAPSAWLADGLATGLMVLGMEEGMTLIRDRMDCEAYLITKDMQTTMSPGFLG